MVQTAAGHASARDEEVSPSPIPSLHLCLENTSTKMPTNMPTHMPTHMPAHMPTHRCTHMSACVSSCLHTCQVLENLLISAQRQHISKHFGAHMYSGSFLMAGRVNRSVPDGSLLHAVTQPMTELSEGRRVVHQDFGAGFVKVFINISIQMSLCTGLSPHN